MPVRSTAFRMSPSVPRRRDNRHLRFQDVEGEAVLAADERTHLPLEGRHLLGAVHASSRLEGSAVEGLPAVAGSPTPVSRRLGLNLRPFEGGSLHHELLMPLGLAVLRVSANLEVADHSDSVAFAEEPGLVRSIDALDRSSGAHPSPSSLTARETVRNSRACRVKVFSTTAPVGGS
jgi:hypothetical protein